jgi:hypothetical protein
LHFLKLCSFIPVDPILDCLVGPVTLVEYWVELLVRRDEEDGGIALEKSLFSVHALIWITEAGFIKGSDFLIGEYNQFIEQAES